MPIWDYLNQRLRDGCPSTGDYIPSELEIVHVREVLEMMKAVTKDDRFTEYVDEFEKSKEAVTMCKVLDEVQARGEQRGEQNAMLLTSYLVKNGRSDDVIRAAEDKDFFNKLLNELMPVLTPVK